MSIDTDNPLELSSATSAVPAPEPAPKTKKKLVRRTAPDHSQRTRLIVQSVFILLNVFLCAKFYLFVQYFESNATGPHVSRPAGVDGWLPIAGLMNTRYLFSTGHIPAIHPAAMVLFLIFIAMSLLMKRAFCSWLCPIGTLSEYLWKAGRRFLGHNATLPRWIDIPLRSIKYLLLAFFVVIVGGESAAYLEDFMNGPYGLLADVKMLHFFMHMSSGAIITILVLVLFSLLIKNFWCRYACPYGALMSLVSLASPVKIRRDQDACVDCGKCAKACPQNLPVDRLVQIRSAECTACLECVASCPAQDGLQLALPPRASTTIAERWTGRTLQPIAAVIVLAALFFSGVGLARITHHWQTNIPDDVYRQLIPESDSLSHPRF